MEAWPNTYCRRGLYEPGSPDSVPLFDIPGADRVAHFPIFAVPVWLLGCITGRIWLVPGTLMFDKSTSRLLREGQNRPGEAIWRSICSRPTGALVRLTPRAP